MKVKILGAHNTETSTARLPGLLVDGRLALDAGSLTSSLSLAEQLAPPAILLTHHHYDHVRDLPILAMNCYLNDVQIHIYGPQEVKESLSAHLMNTALYTPFLDKEVAIYHVVEPNKPFQIEGYEITAVPVNHSVPSVGYEIKAGGRCLFYTGDTGGRLFDVWKQVTPDLLVIEMTASNRWTEFSKQSRHLTPKLLHDELLIIKKQRGLIPKVVTVHMNPALEHEIRPQLALVADELGCEITAGVEGMEIEV
jgi:phosphoribosyl 1,2-cyclic phosphodiesterase